MPLADLSLPPLRPEPDESRRDESLRDDAPPLDDPPLDDPPSLDELPLGAESLLEESPPLDDESLLEESPLREPPFSLRPSLSLPPWFSLLLLMYLAVYRWPGTVCTAAITIFNPNSLATIRLQRMLGLKRALISGEFI
jgi:hypothetical protein